MPTSAASDVIVIGAGVVGCSLAFHLASAGTATRVFDKSNICGGMSSRSGALIRMHYSFAPEVELAWQSLEYFTNWRSLVGGECGFVRTGFILVVGADNVARLRANVTMMKRVGVAVDSCDGAELRRLAPWMELDDIALGAYEPLSGYADPVATTQALAAAAQRHGADFQLHCKVTEILVDHGRVSGVRAGGRNFEADAVCVVAGPWSGRLLEPLGISMALTAERAQIAFFRRPADQSHLGCIDCVNGSYFRPHGAGMTLAGMGSWRPENEPDPDAFRESNDREFIEQVRARLAARMPSMSEAPYVRGHAGIYDVSPDSRAILGRVNGVDGLFVAAGFSGTGFKTAPAVGAAMAELIRTGQSRVDISGFALGRLASGHLIHPENEYVMGRGFGHTL